MGDPATGARSDRPAPPGRPASTATTYAPDAATRAQLAFADGPPPPDDPGSRGRPGPAPGPSRVALLGAAAAVAIVVVGAVLAFAVAGGSDSATSGDIPREADRGPFASNDAFLAALPLPATFRRLPDEDVSAIATADAEYVVDGDFAAACAALGQALRALDPTFPELVPKDYAGGGVNRCEAEAPMVALHGTTVRALVLEANTGAQLHIADAGPPASAP